MPASHLLAHQLLFLPHPSFKKEEWNAMEVWGEASVHLVQLSSPPHLLLYKLTLFLLERKKQKWKVKESKQAIGGKSF